MKFFAELGARVDDAWRERDYDEGVFPEVATACLEATRPSDHVDMMDVIRWVHGTRDLYRAEFNKEFGQPPVVIFRARHFYIEVLFWLESTTSIHQHGFSGAFHVLQGSSIHSQYSFERTKRYSERLSIGELAVESIEHLEKGAVRPIRQGSGTIHALFHLDHPSISVVVRTYHSAVTEPQYQYLHPGIAYDPFYSHESLYLRQRTLSVLRRVKHPEFEETAIRAIREADPLEAFLLALELVRTIESAEDYDALIAKVAPSHAELMAKVGPMSDAERRMTNIARRRSTIHAKEHRFFLAVLLNVPSRRECLRLVEAVYPGSSPVDRVVKWTEELGTQQVRDPATGEMSSLIGVRMDEASLVVLRHLLSGATSEQVLSRLREEFHPDDVDSQRQDIIELCDAYRSSELFGRILSD